MNKSTSLNLVSELLWWLAAAVAVVLVLLPLHGNIAADYVTRTAIMALVFVKLFRFAVFLPTIPYLRPIAVKLVLIVASVAFIFTLLLWMQKFYLNADTHNITRYIHFDKQSYNMQWQNEQFDRFKSIYLFLLVGCMLLPIALDLRMIGNMWKSKKK